MLCAGQGMGRSNGAELCTHVLRAHTVSRALCAWELASASNRYGLIGNEAGTRGLRPPSPL